MAFQWPSEMEEGEDMGSYRIEPVAITRMTKRITKNAVRCRKCGEEIESRHVHDFVRCGCGSVAVDGGHEYLRRVGNTEMAEERSEYAE